MQYKSLPVIYKVKPRKYEAARSWLRRHAKHPKKQLNVRSCLWDVRDIEAFESQYQEKGEDYDYDKLLSYLEKPSTMLDFAFTLMLNNINCSEFIAYEVLKYGFRNNLVKRTGKGTKGSPYYYEPIQ